jgi:histidinol-phosphate aminotransferase
MIKPRKGTGVLMREQAGSDDATGLGGAAEGHDTRPTPLTHQSSFRPAVHKLTDYEPGRSVEEVSRELGIPPDQIVKLSSNENPYGPSPSALLAILTQFTRFYLYPWQEYTDLRHAVAAANGVAPANVVLASGSEAIVQMIPRLYVEPGDEVVVAAQTYSRYAAASILMNAALRSVPLADYRVDLEAMAGLVGPRTKIIWLCSPNNPTGTIVRRAEMERLLAAIPETVAVVVDQAYGEFADDPDYADGVTLFREGHPNLIVLKTFSKAYGLAGLRLGYAIADAAVCRMLDRIEEPFFLNRAATAAGPAALADRAWLEHTLQAVRQGRSYLEGELARLGCDVVPSQANFVFAGVHQDARDLFQRLLRRGVIVRPCDAWGFPTHLRITVGKPEQNERCVAALAQELH